MADKVTEGERRNGWSEASLRAYLKERDLAVNLAHRLGAVPVQRRVVVERDYEPHDF